MAILTRGWSLALAPLLAAAVVRSAASAQESIENDVKAAFVYNFSKFVEWPAAPQGAFRICAVADAQFTQALDRIIEGESVQGHPLARVEPRSPAEARTCNILYIGQGEHERGSRLLAGVGQAPVLTVSDAPRFLEEGGAIGFVLENNRVRFDVSTKATTRAGLRVSSKLLRIARSVTDGTQP